MNTTTRIISHYIENISYDCSSPYAIEYTRSHFISFVPRTYTFDIRLCACVCDYIVSFIAHFCWFVTLFFPIQPYIDTYTHTKYCFRISDALANHTLSLLLSFSACILVCIITIIIFFSLLFS